MHRLVRLEGLALERPQLKRSAHYKSINTAFLPYGVIYQDLEEKMVFYMIYYRCYFKVMKEMYCGYRRIFC
jgi:hypothetical protein